MAAITFRHLSDLLPIVQPYANGCPSFVLEQAMRFAAIEMCERGRIWRHIMEFDARAPVMADLIPAEACIFEFDYALADGRPLTPVQHTQVATEGARMGSPAYISQVNPWGIVIHPWPEGTAPVAIELAVFLKPRSDTIVGLDAANPTADVLNVVPDWMLSQHSHRLADGALSRVLMMEGEAWYNPQRAAVSEERYDTAMKRLTSSPLRGQQRAPIRSPSVYM